MSFIRFFSFGLFPTLHNRDEFFQKLIDPKNSVGKIVNQFVLLCLFAFFYGVIMGCYHSVAQAIAAGVKVVLLFALVIAVCFPAFFIIQYILGSKLRVGQMLNVILSGFVLTGAIMASFAPIVVFFLLTGGNYYFLQLLHVAIFLFSGFFGMKTIIDALKYSCENKAVYPQTGVTVFRVWVVILAFVGIQLAWNLRPFLGDRGQSFEMFREYDGNFYTALIYSAQQLLEQDRQSGQGHRPTYPGHDTPAIDSVRSDSIVQHLLGSE